MTVIRRLDHVAVVVSDTHEALKHFSGRLGLQVVHAEELTSPRVRLTYLDAGNAFIQLVEPLDEHSDIARVLHAEGEGVHHLCFGVRDVTEAVGALSDPASTPPPLGQGRGRVSGFIAGPPNHGVRVECTEFSYAIDVQQVNGWLPDSNVEPQKDPQ